MDRTAPTSLFAWPSLHRRSAEERALRRDLRRTVVTSNLFEFAIALASLVSVPIILLSARGIGGSAVGHLTHMLAPFWLALFAGGGLFIVVGLLKLSPRAEIVGLLFLIAASVTDGVAILLYSGGSGAAGATTFLAFGCAAGWRAHLVWRLVLAAAHRAGENVR